MKMYQPAKGSWGEKIINYLKEHGESSNFDIRMGIGIDEYYKTRSWYPDHGRYYFNGVVMYRLVRKGIVIRTRRGYYKLDEW